MAEKTKTREITITEDKGTFTTFFGMFGSTKNYNFDGLATLRKILTNEKARLLNTIKYKKPNSIYSLAKSVGRDFKSVSDDVKFLEKFGFVEFISEKSGKRERLKPILVVDSINIKIKI